MKSILRNSIKEIKTARNRIFENMYEIAIMTNKPPVLRELAKLVKTLDKINTTLLQVSILHENKQ